MSSSIMRQCRFCKQMIDCPIPSAAFVENPLCNQCALSVSESNLKMQDDLAILFATHMNIGALMPTSNHQESSPSVTSSSQPLPISYSITQHYHHSSHLALQTAAAKGPGRVSPSGSGSALSMDNILRSHNIDPLSPSSNQLSLFEGARQDQRTQLIQIWQICPESNEKSRLGEISSVSLDKQTQELKTGYGFMEDVRELPQSPQGDLEMEDPVQEESFDDGEQYAEPYMASGYESIAQKELRGRDAQGTFGKFESAPLPNEPTTGSPYLISRDPVYQSRQWWEPTERGPVEYQRREIEQSNWFPGSKVLARCWP